MRLKPSTPDVTELFVTEQDVDEAIKDYDLIFEAIQRFVVGNEVQQHKVPEAIFQLLREFSCFSKESSTLSTSQVVKTVVERTQVSESVVEYHFYQLRKKGKINSLQEGQYSGKVWLE